MKSGSVKRARAYSESALPRIQASAASVVVGEFTCAVESAGFTNERDDSLGLDADKVFFFENAGDECTGVAMAVFHGVDQRHGDFAFFQVTEDRLAKLFGGRREIQQVVHHLECEAGIASVIC